MVKKVTKGSKPAVDNTPARVLIGSPVKIVVAAGHWTCPKCQTTRRSGMVYRHDGVEYCSRRCITA